MCVEQRNLNPACGWSFRSPLEQAKFNPHCFHPHNSVTHCVEFHFKIMWDTGNPAVPQAKLALTTSASWKAEASCLEACYVKVLGGNWVFQLLVSASGSVAAEQWIMQ